MRSTATLDGVEYAPGRKFKVTRAGCELSGMKPDGPYSWRGYKRPLEVGEVITCAGFGAGFGGDPGYGVEFYEAGVGTCEFRPSTGSMWTYRPQPGCLEPIEEKEGAA